MILSNSHHQAFIRVDGKLYAIRLVLPMKYLDEINKFLFRNSDTAVIDQDDNDMVYVVDRHPTA